MILSLRSAMPDVEGLKDILRMHAFACGKGLSTLEISSALAESEQNLDVAIAKLGLPPRTEEAKGRAKIVKDALARAKSDVEQARPQSEEASVPPSSMAAVKKPLLPPGHVPSDTPTPRPRPLVRQKSSFEEPYRIQRASSHVWSTERESYSGSHAVALRHGFLRKVFGILLAQIVLTAYVSVKMLEAGQQRVDYARANPEYLSADVCKDTCCGEDCQLTKDGVCDDGGPGSEHSMCPFGEDCFDCALRPTGTQIPVLAVSVAIEPYRPYFLFCFFFSFLLIFCVHAHKNHYPTNYFLLFAFTAVESFFVGFMCTVYGVDQQYVVIEAFVLTAAIFAGLTIFTMQAKLELSVFGGVLFMILFGLLVMSFLRAIFFPDAEGLRMFLVYVGIVLFSAYIMYDVSMIMNKLGYDDYIVAALELYLDIINLFIRILQVLGGRSSNN